MKTLTPWLVSESPVANPTAANRVTDGRSSYATRAPTSKTTISVCRLIVPACVACAHTLWPVVNTTVASKPARRERARMAVTTKSATPAAMA